jgi:hypothetical protein
MSCLICNEKIRAGTIVSCAKCSGSCCRTCFQTYLLNSPLAVPCMHCRTVLSDDFIITNTTTKWRLSLYKDYKEQVLLDVEKAKLPESQKYAVAVKEAKYLLVSLEKQLVELYGMPYSVIEKTADSIRENIAVCQRIIDTFGEEVVVGPDNKIIVKACPVGGCRGFLSGDFSCGLCKTSVCVDCHEIKVYGHICLADNIASVKALAKEAKPCPSCAATISKIDGCDQMWCTQCQTTFSWRTGLKELGRVHNPHFYEWMRRNGGMPREAEDECGVPGINSFWILFGVDVNVEYDIMRTGWLKYNDYKISLLRKGSQTLMKEPKKTLEAPKFEGSCDTEPMALANLVVYHQAIGHRVANIDGVQHPEDNHDLRVKYLLGIVDEVKFKTEIQKRAKSNQKRRAISQVNNMLLLASNDLYRYYYANLKAAALARALLEERINIHQSFNKEMMELIKYANNCYIKLGDAFGNDVSIVYLAYV